VYRDLSASIADEITRLDRRVHPLQVEHDFHVDEALAELPVHGAEEVEGQRKLEHQLVHHDKVADGHRACHES
jgi:hypothetical protein